MNRSMMNGLQLAERLGLRGNPWTALGDGPLREWLAALFEPEPAAL